MWCTLHVKFVMKDAGGHGQDQKDSSQHSRATLHSPMSLQ